MNQSIKRGDHKVASEDITGWILIEVELFVFNFGFDCLIIMLSRVPSSDQRVAGLAITGSTVVNLFWTVGE